MTTPRKGERRLNCTGPLTCLGVVEGYVVVRHLSFEVTCLSLYKWNKLDPLPSLAKEPPVSRKREHARDLCFEALAKDCGINLHEITPSLGGVIGKALKEVRTVAPNVTPEEITARIATYKRIHREWPCTPAAIAKHWAWLGHLSPGELDTCRRKTAQVARLTKERDAILALAPIPDEPDTMAARTAKLADLERQMGYFA